MKVQHQVPFFANTSDNTHCFQAVLKMVLKYFQPDKDYSWDELDILSDKQPGLGTWSTRALLNLQKIGFKVVVIDNFNYQKFAKLGASYLTQKYGQSVAKSQIKQSNLKKEQSDALEYFQLNGNHDQSATIEKISQLLETGYLIKTSLNYYALNNKTGYQGHSVLVTGVDTDKKIITFHDPGLPSHENRQVGYQDFTKAWAWPTEKEQNLIGFKLI